METTKTNYYRLSPSLTLVNESAIFTADVKPYCVYDQRNCLFHYCDQDDYELLKYMLKWREEKQILDFMASNRQVMQGDWSAYLDSFLDRKIVDVTEDAPAKDDNSIAAHFVAPKMKYIDQKPKGFPASIALGITNECNLRCRHCSQNAGKSHAKEGLTAKDLKKLFDQFEKYGLWELRITGGEPFCHPEILDVLWDIVGRRFKLILFTNGTILTDQHKKVLRKLKEKKGYAFRVHMSVDGCCATEHDYIRGREGSFDKLINFMKFMKEIEVPWVAETIVYKKNANEDSIAKIAELCCEHGCENLMLHTASIRGRAGKLSRFHDDFFISVEDLQRLGDFTSRIQSKYCHLMRMSFGNTGLVASQLAGPRQKRKTEIQSILQEQEFHKDSCDCKSSGHECDEKEIILPSRTLKRCSAGVNQAYIEEDGNVYPCPFFVSDKFFAGNIKKKDFLSIWNSDNFLFCRGDWADEDISVCNSCSEKLNCGLPFACRAVPLQTYGDELGPSPECMVRYHKELKPLGVNVSEKDEATISDYLDIANS